MKALFSINHPGHVHFFRNAIDICQKKGIETIVIARDKDITLTLLDKYNIPYVIGSKQSNGLIKNIFEILRYQFKIFKLMKKCKPNVLLSIGGLFNIYAARICGIRHLIFNDTEHAKLDHTLTYPFTKKVYTPNCYLKDIGKKQIRYKGYHELAYLHPNYFSPEPSVLDEIGISQTQPFFILRFVSWDAAHDIGHKGFTLEGKRELIKLLEKHGRVIITSEAPLPVEFEKYRMSICPTKIHDLLYYSTMYIGEGGTMASEGAVLGTPSIFVNTLTLGYLEELENKYDLMYSFKKENEAINKTKELLKIPDLKVKWQMKRQKMLNEKIDVTAWMVEMIENINGK